MKKSILLILTALVSSLILFAAAVSTNTGVFTIKGTSNVQDWTSISEKATVSGELIMEGTTLMSVNNFNVVVPVKSIISKKGSVMDSKTWTSLKVKKHPNIKFTMTKLNSMTKFGSTYDIYIAGKLSIAGVSENVNLKITGIVLKGGKVKFTGTTKIKMTDYGIDPPTAFFGAMTTGDEITLSFSIVYLKCYPLFVSKT